jgi:UDP-N-acetylmuramoylalanine--D-glutamate ligase
MSKKSVAILGGGESGVGAALLAQANGYKVFLSDQSSLKDHYRADLNRAGIAFEEGQHTETRILTATEVIKSPGIPDTAPLVQKLRAQGTPVISEIEFAARYTTAKLIGITGSNGKTTTALLTYHLLKTAGFNVGLAGNIGDSFARSVLENQFDYYVLEISSFQLDGMYDIRLDVAVLLNITPDHLDRYGYDFQNYVNSKFRITQNLRPNDPFIYFQENPAIAAELVERSLLVRHLPFSINQAVKPGGYVQDGRITVQADDLLFTTKTAGLPLSGQHNAMNMMASLLAAQSVGVSNQLLLTGLQTFINAPHRLEPVATINEVRFINDSKATNVDSVFYALDSMTAPTVWIAGGIDKGNDYSVLDELVKRHVKTLICLGKDSSKLNAHFGGIIPTILETDNINEAVQLAASLAGPGDVVLLSPACASFDLFKNYEDRGNQFKEAVNTLLIQEVRRQTHD